MNERRPWTPDDIAKLKSMARRFPSARIARELRRGLPATVMKAHTLGISLRLKPKRGSGRTDISVKAEALAPQPQERDTVQSPADSLPCQKRPGALSNRIETKAKMTAGDDPKELGPPELKVKK